MSTKIQESWYKRSGRRFGWGIMTFFAVSIAIFAAGPYITFNPGVSQIPLNSEVVTHFVVLAFHAITGGLALLIGPFQFLTSIRTRSPIIHRTLGRIYLLAVMLGSLFALHSAIASTASFVARVSFTILAIIWFYSAAQAYISIRRGQVQLHRIWMIRNYALTLSAIFLRLWLGFGLAYIKITTDNIPEVVTSTDIYTSGTWISWSVPLIIAEWFIIQRSLRTLTPKPERSKETQQKILVEKGS